MNKLVSKSGLLPEKAGYRDFSYGKFSKHFGGPVFTPRQDSYDLTPSWVEILDQLDLDICTACSLATGKSVVEGFPVDPLWQFKETKKIEGRYTTYGANPLHAIKAMQGGALQAKLSPFKIGVQDRLTFANWKNWPSNLDDAAKTVPSGAWFRADGQSDLFDSTRQVLQAHGTQAIVVIDLYWQPHWTYATRGIINYDGIYAEINPHQVYLRVAQAIINGQPYLKISNSYGKNVGDDGVFYFDRKTFNMFDRYDGGVKVLLDADPAQVKKATWSVLQKAFDWLMKLLSQVNNPPLPTNEVIENSTVMPEPVKSDDSKPMNKIMDWALSIEQQEGGRPQDLNMRLNNPGNLKYAPLTASWGGKKDLPGSDGGSFCRFDTYEQGFQALCNFLTLAAEDKLKDYHQSRTLLAFTRKYANPPNDNYANNVAKALKVGVDTDISTFI